MPLILFPGGGAASPPTARAYFDAFQVIDRIPTALAAEGYSSMVFWTEAEILDYVNDSLMELLRLTGVNVEHDDSADTVQDQAAYATPTRTFDVLEISKGGEKMRPSSNAELAALDDAWTLTSGAARRWTEGRGANEYILYPIPDTGGDELSLLVHRWLTDVSRGSPYIQIPDVLQDYMFHRAVADARRKESIAAMPEAASFSDNVAKLIADAGTRYWGGTQ